MATDIMDKELVGLCDSRWEKAFSESMSFSNEELENRKATIVIMEHLIQTSDIVHTMQHWHVFCKWNERLYFEQMQAFANYSTSREERVLRCLPN